MADKKIIVVFGATGQQGGSVVDFLLKDGTFSVRGVTRNVDSDKAKALTARGVEMVAANVADPASFAKGKGVFDGAYGAFIVTNFWDASSMGKEKEQGIALVDAAEACGVAALQYGSLVDVEQISGGKLNVPHFTDKAKVEQYILNEKKFEFTAFPAAAFYFSNMLTFFPPKVDEDGVSVFTLPNTRSITGFDVSDIGGVSLAIFLNPAKYNRLFVPCSGEHFSPAEFLEKFEKHTGKKGKLNLVTFEQFAGFGFPGAEELAAMFQFFDEYTYYGLQSKRELGVRAYAGLKDLDQWFESAKGEF